MLPGITYDLVLELAAASGMPHAVREVSERETLTADELWLTSSTKEVLAITTLNGRPVGHGQAGPAVPAHARAVPGIQGGERSERRRARPTTRQRTHEKGRGRRA